MDKAASQEPTPVAVETPKAVEPEEPTTMEEMAGEGEWVKLRIGIKDGKPVLKDYLILPLLLKDVKRFLALNDQIMSQEASGNLETVGDLLIECSHLILKQAYPDISAEDVAGIVSMKTYKKVSQIAYDISGIDELLERAKNRISPSRRL